MNAQYYYVAIDDCCYRTFLVARIEHHLLNPLLYHSLRLLLMFTASYKTCAIVLT